ncbi:MAG: peptidyl-prolyl cis-trans isomerase, partial [Acidobacteriota bacterium]
MHRTSTATALPILLCAIGLLAAPQPSNAATEVVNRVIMRVNDVILTLHDYEERKEDEVNTLLSDPQVSPADRQERLAAIGQETMQQVFREMLLESFARRNGMTVSEREVDDAVQQVQERQGFTTPQAMLDAMNQAGVSMEKLRRNLRQELLLSTVVRRHVTGKIEVGDDELRTFYRGNPEMFEVEEERRLEEIIVLEDSGLPADQLLTTAQAMLAELSGGADFETVAGKYQDQGLTTGVIDLGWVKRGDLAEDLSTAAFAVPADGYSEPVKARGGIHIVHASEVKEGYVRPFDEVKNWIINRERQRRFGTELRKFMVDIEESSFIQEDLPEEAVGFRSLTDDYIPDEDELRNF